MEVIIRKSASDAAALAAGIIAEELRAKPDLVLGLATGRTMESVYNILVSMHQDEGLDFSLCRTFNLDEYVGLPASDRNSYRHYMNTRLFERVNIDLRNTSLPDGTASDLEAECSVYEEAIKAAGGIDLQLLGIGENGHIGFNEPGSAFTTRTRVEGLSQATIDQNAPLFDEPGKMPGSAITMGIGTILESKRCILLATGAAKAEVAAKAIEGPADPAIPASALQMHGRCTIVLDAEAASKLIKRCTLVP